LKKAFDKAKRDVVWKCMERVSRTGKSHNIKIGNTKIKQISNT
jgi:hypothetical protein